MRTQPTLTGRPRQRHTTILMAAAATAVLLTPGIAKAATFSAAELSYDNALLSQFNLINLGNFNSSAGSIGGRSVIGGNATLSGTTVCTSTSTSTKPCGDTTKAINATGVSTGYGALTVFGNLWGGATVGASQVSGTPAAGTGGDIDIKGNIDGKTYNLNNAGGINLGGTSQPGTTATQLTEYRTVEATPPAGSGSSVGSNFSAANSGSGYSLAQVFAPFGNSNTLLNTFSTPLKNLSVGLAALPGTPGVTAQTLPPKDTSVFLASSDFTVNGKSYGVVTTTLANLVAEGTKFGGVSNGSSNAATIVIVSGDITNAVLPTLSYTDSNVIYDFVNATSLIAAAAFSGSILAPLASLTQTSAGVINGTVVVAGMNQMAMLASGNVFTGDLTGFSNLSYPVDEPASILLLALATTAVAAISTRRRVKPLSLAAAKSA